METIEISVEDFRDLVKCQARLELLQSLIKLADSEYITRATMALFAGIDEKNERRD